MTKFDDVKNVSTSDYFEGNQFSIDAFEKKYALREEETYVEAIWRVCVNIASCEKTSKLRKYWAERWFDEIYNDWWHPAGSIMQGAGNEKKISTANCTHISLGTNRPDEEWDSLEGIIKNTGYTVAKSAAYRQGLGVDFSRIRPLGTVVENSANKSTGAVHWMGFIDNIANYVGQSGRIPAFLFSLSCTHPDVEEFITVKSDYTRIQNANISVQCTDDFYRAVLEDKDWNLEFVIPAVKKGDKVYVDANSTTSSCFCDEKGWYYTATKDKKREVLKKTVKARALMELIAKNMHANAEPGIQNIDIAKHYSNSDYFEIDEDGFDSSIVGTNACCVTGSTLVLTDKGELPIIDLVDKEVNVWNGLEYRPVIPFFAGSKCRVYKVQLSDGNYLDCTDNHKWHITDKKTGDVKVVYTFELTNGDQLASFFSPVGFRLSNDLNKKVYVDHVKYLGKRDVYCFTEPKNHTGCFNRIVTGQSEQYLNRDGLCILSSINCEMFSVDQEEYKSELQKIGESINRFLDNVITYELEKKTYATELQRQSLEKLRRTGAGYTNIAAWLFKSGLEYGTEAANDAMGDFTKWYNYALYDSSIRLGHEKGSFGLFDADSFMKSPFVKRMSEEFGLEFDAMRNVTCSSIAPSGSLSTQFRRTIMSYGIEPAFGMYYWKRTRISGEYKYYFCVPRVVRELYERKGYKIPIDSDTVEDTWDGSIGKPVGEFIEKHKGAVGVSFAPASSISAMDKLDLMAKVMKWVDSSISVTYMLPEESTWKDVYDFILEAWSRGVKSIAAFPDKKMYGIVSLEPFKELAVRLKNEGVKLHYDNNFTDKEKEELGAEEDKTIQLNTQQAPKRPKKLEADVHIANAKGNKYIIAVGKLNGQPYEVFGGRANGFGIKQKCSGWLIKRSKGKYGLELDSIEIDDFSEHFTPEEQTIFRLASTNLRHGVPIEFTVDQMQKSTDDMFSLPSALARVLKKYIKDGQPVVGKKCPSCGSTELVYQDGCVSCSACDWSKCE